MMTRSFDDDVLSKVPAVTLGFWIIKILATTLGETAGDTVSMSWNLGYLVGTAIFGTSDGHAPRATTGAHTAITTQQATARRIVRSAWQRVTSGSFVGGNRAHQLQSV